MGCRESVNLERCEYFNKKLLKDVGLIDESDEGKQ